MKADIENIIFALDMYAALGVVEELADVFLCLVVHVVAFKLSSRSNLKKLYAPNNNQIASSSARNDINTEPSLRLFMLSHADTANARSNIIVGIALSLIGSPLYPFSIAF